MDKEKIKIIATNKKIGQSYDVIETYEAGISLLGTEVKAARDSRVNLKDGYGFAKDGEIFLRDVYIGPYSHANRFNHDPYRERKLLLKKREILRLIGKMKEKGMTIVPKRMYLKNGKIKVEIALVKGKKKHDIREAIKRKIIQREIERELKRSR